jgi:hypothetical protein
MAKTEQTKKLEYEIWKATQKQGVFGCLEVTIGWFGNERVDYMTYDTNNIWRCFEIKVSKSDFHSKAHNTFVGHFNYYVMTQELFEQVKNEIPEYIGVYIGGYLTRKAKKQELKVDEQVLKNSMIRSLCREAEKIFQSQDHLLIERKNKQISTMEKQLKSAERAYWNLMSKVITKYGADWNRCEDIG